MAERDARRDVRRVSGWLQRGSAHDLETFLAALRPRCRRPARAVATVAWRCAEYVGGGVDEWSGSTRATGYPSGTAGVSWPAAASVRRPRRVGPGRSGR